MLPAGAGAGKDSMSWLAKLLGGVGGIGGGSGGSMSGVSGSIKGVGDAFKSLADLFKKSPSSSSSGAGLSAADSWNYDLDAEAAQAGFGPDYSPFAPAGSFGQPASFDGYTASDFTGGIGDYSPSPSTYDFFAYNYTPPNYSALDYFNKPNSYGSSYVPSFGSGASLYDFYGYGGAGAFDTTPVSSHYNPGASYSNATELYPTGGYGNGYGGASFSGGYDSGSYTPPDAPGGYDYSPDGI